VATGESEVAAELDRLASTGGDTPSSPAELTSRAAEVRGEAGALRDAVEHTAADLDRCRARQRELASTAAQLGIDGVPTSELEAAADEARLALEAAEASSAAAREALRATTGDERSLAARVDALRLALDHVHTEAGLRELSDIDGVVGTLLDLVEVADGFEAAVEAAVGDAISAVVTADGAAARDVLARLHAGDRRGAVLVLDDLAQVGDGEPPAGAPWTDDRPVGRPVLDLVWSSDPAVGRLLRRLVGDAVVVEGGWESAVDAALVHPELVVVTSGGDRFGRSGWRVGAGGRGATAAALEDATAGLAAAEGRLAAARRGLTEAEAGLQAARRAASEATSRLDAAGRLAAESGPAGERIAELEPRLERDRRRLAELVELLPVLEADEAHGRRAAEERAALRGDAEARLARLRERGELLDRRLADVERRLEDNRRERDGAATRRQRLDGQLGAIDRLAAVATAHLGRLDGQLEGLRDRRRRQSAAARAAADELEGLRRRRSALDGELEAARDAAGRLDVEEAEATLRLETAIDIVRIELDSEPEVAEAAPVPELPDGATVAGWIRELERELRRLGPINALALEEYDQLRERHDFVAAQLDDVRTSRRELNKVIAAIDEEIVRVFAAAFADVSANFEQLFAHLFPGGTGRLRLTDPGDLLGTGVELDARPSGKNVRQLSLLSGGERSLTALAYLFAIFRSRPSPFYVLDEVEAALDDVNLHRFLSLVDEFRREAQLLIVSHQKRTMEAADCLYGVSMQPGGSSKVVSERPTTRDASAA
jgi:chromosome segregation protein